MNVAIALDFMKNGKCSVQELESEVRAGAVPSACYGFSIDKVKQYTSACRTCRIPTKFPIWVTLSGIPPKRYGGVRVCVVHLIVHRLSGHVFIRDTSHI